MRTTGGIASIGMLMKAGSIGLFCISHGSSYSTRLSAASAGTGSVQ